MARSAKPRIDRSRLGDPRLDARWKTPRIRNGLAAIEATLSLEPTFSVVSQKIVYEGSFATTSIHANFDIAPSQKEYLVFDNSQVCHDSRLEIRAAISLEGIRQYSLMHYILTQWSKVIGAICYY